MSVRDEIVCNDPQSITWVFMLRHEPVIDHERQCCHLKDSGFWIDWSENADLSAAAEPIEITDGRMKNSYPGTLWRLTLTAAPSTHHTQQFMFEA